MNLTKWQKQAIVRAIMDDVPVDEDKLAERVQAAFVVAMTESCSEAYYRCPNALKTATFYNVVARQGLRVIIGDVGNSEEIIRPFEEAHEKIKEAERELTTAIQACRNVKQLNDRFPEFKKYFPNENEPTKNLPMADSIVASLVKLGWAPK